MIPGGGAGVRILGDGAGVVLGAGIGSDRFLITGTYGADRSFGRRSNCRTRRAAYGVLSTQCNAVFRTVRKAGKGVRSLIAVDFYRFLS